MALTLQSQPMTRSSTSLSDRASRIPPSLQLLSLKPIPSSRPQNLRCASLSPAIRRRHVSAAAASSESSPAPPSADKPKADKPTVAEFARTMMEMGDEGTLCTVHPQLGGALGTHVAYVIDAVGRPILALSPHSLALGDLRESSQCSLHVQVELPGLQKPQVTICGHARPPEDAPEAMRLELGWSRKFGEGSQGSTTDAGAPLLWLLSVERVLVAADVDQEPAWISAAEFLEADADPLKDVARKIVEDVNRENWQDLLLFPHAFLGIEEEVDDASLIWVDKQGIDLRVWLRSSLGEYPLMREIRIPFKREAGDEREARSSITMMAQVAWEKERNYNPQMPSLVPTPLSDK